MKLIINISFLALLVFTLSCSKKDENVTILEKSLETQMIEVYNQAMEEFEREMLFMLEKFIG